MGICEIGRYENFKNIKRDVEFSTSQTVDKAVRKTSILRTASLF